MPTLRRALGRGIVAAMGTVEQNRATWDAEYPWPERGDEWSEAWGSAEAQWTGSILPRVRAYLPAASVLEIAPGYGRWTQFLAPLAQRLTVVDLSAQCIAACQQRFADQSHLAYHVNDGRSLAMVPDRSVDFAFSFDSLVHAEADVVAAYLHELARVLTSDGVAFLHHSNIGVYWVAKAITRALPTRVIRRCITEGLLPEDGWRAYSMTARRFRRLATSAGLACPSQEVVNWGRDRLTDCFSVVTRLGSQHASPPTYRVNRCFMAEAAVIRALRPSADR